MGGTSTINQRAAPRPVRTGQEVIDGDSVGVDRHDRAVPHSARSGTPGLGGRSTTPSSGSTVTRRCQAARDRGHCPRLARVPGARRAVPGRQRRDRHPVDVSTGLFRRPGTLTGSRAGRGRSRVVYAARPAVLSRARAPKWAAPGAAAASSRAGDADQVQAGAPPARFHPAVAITAGDLAVPRRDDEAPGMCGGAGRGPAGRYLAITLPQRGQRRAGQRGGTAVERGGPTPSICAPGRLAACFEAWN